MGAIFEYLNSVRHRRHYPRERGIINPSPPLTEHKLSALRSSQQIVELLNL